MSARRSVPPASAAEIVAVIGGGLIGTAARWSLDTLIPHTDETFPVSTLLINVVGAFALAILVSTLWRRTSTPAWLKAGLGAGVLGTFTTFSAFALSLVVQAREGLWGMALLYLAASLVLGFGAAALGLLIGGRAFGAPRTHGGPSGGPTPPEPDWVDE